MEISQIEELFKQLNTKVTSGFDQINTRLSLVELSVASVASVDEESQILPLSLFLQPNYHPIQLELAANGGTQCGFCRF